LNHKPIPMFKETWMNHMQDITIRKKSLALRRVRSFSFSLSLKSVRLLNPDADVFSAHYFFSSLVSFPVAWLNAKCIQNTAI
jgi:hypothetical protein